MPGGPVGRSLITRTSERRQRVRPVQILRDARLLRRPSRPPVGCFRVLAATTRLAHHTTERERRLGLSLIQPQRAPDWRWRVSRVRAGGGARAAVAYFGAKQRGFSMQYQLIPAQLVLQPW